MAGTRERTMSDVVRCTECPDGCPDPGRTPKCGDCVRVTVSEIPAGVEVPAHLRAGINASDPDKAGDVDVPDPFMETPEQARERVQRQQAAKHARWFERLPDDYAHAALSDFPGPMAGVLQRALDDPAVRNIVLAGPFGTGKTHAAYALGRVAVERGLWVEAWTVRDLMKQMLPDGNPELMEKRARGCALLILDDLGASRVSAFAIETITGIVDHRVSRRMKTIVTTNASEEALRAVWEGRLLDRLRHGVAPVEFTGQSRRGPAW
jgi:DNA replication protein DnaC